MNSNYEKFRAEVFSAMRGLANDCPEFSDAEMLVASSDVTASLKRNTVHKNIDVEWVERIEHTLPYLDVIVRSPTIMIEDVDEILPVELSRNISEKTIKHLAQHTNMILNITDDGEVIPQKLLNVFHEESLLTYENKFINTLLVRLSVFVDKRYKLLQGGYGTERNYEFRYATEFEHYATEDSGRNLAKLKLSIDLVSPITTDLSESDLEANDQYKTTLERIQKISNALMSYMSSSYVRALGRNYIRPPVIRTNAILKNKNMKECLNLWEYMESFDKAGFSFVSDEFTEMPSDNYITDLYSSVALQYTSFYNGVAENPNDNRILANRHLSEVYPEFDSSFQLEDLEDYRVYDSEYKKTVPVSRLMNNRKKLSEDEHRVRLAIIVALKADEMLNAEALAKEAEERRLEREKHRAEEEERRRAEEEAKRRAEEEAKRRAEEEERRRAEEEARKQAEEEERRRAEEEARKQAEEEERLRAEEEARRQAEEEAAVPPKMDDEEENSLAMMIDQIMSSDAEDEQDQYAVVNVSGSSHIVHKKSGDKQNDFAYADNEDALKDENAVMIPYTREQYLALPRKKKKNVLMNVKKMIAYRNTRAMLDMLESMNTENPRILERMRLLEERLAEEAKCLPTSPLWEASVQRLKK